MRVNEVNKVNINRITFRESYWDDQIDQVKRGYLKKMLQLRLLDSYQRAGWTADKKI